MERRLYVDLETTGLNPYEHGVIQLGAIMEVNGSVVDTLNMAIKPFKRDLISKEALKVNRVDMDTLLTSPDYLPPNEALRIFMKFLSAYVDKFNKQDKLYLIGYNVHAFDGPFLRRWFEKCGDKYYGSWFWHPPIDVMLIAMYVLRHKRPTMQNFKLQTVAHALKIPWDEAEAHDAMYDVEQTRRVLQVLEKEYGLSVVKH